MSKTIKFIFASVIVFGVGLFIFYQLNKPEAEEAVNKPAETQTDDQLRVVKTNPDPLDEATILPTQSIEITFNKEIPKSEFKHQFDPEIKGYEIEAIGGGDATKGTTMKVNFKEPLELGGGYTLVIQNSTRTNDGKNLDHQYEYHFKTIQYKGV